METPQTWALRAWRVRGMSVVSPLGRRWRGRYDVSSAASFSGSTRSSFITPKVSNVLAETDGGAPCPQSESHVLGDPVRRPGPRPHPQDAVFN